MARGPRKHLKRLNAPKHWMLDKLSGAFAPRPSSGPHKLRECLPLALFIRNRLKYALTLDEARKITKQRLVKVDGKVRTDVTFPAGIMDVISLEKTGENFRLVYDTKGRYAIHRISAEEAKFKLCKVKKALVGPKGVPFVVTHDGRTIRYPDPAVKMNDTIVFGYRHVQDQGYNQIRFRKPLHGDRRSQRWSYRIGHSSGTPSGWFRYRAHQRRRRKHLRY